MLDFNIFISRHGEHGAQAIVERMERYEGIRPTFGATLEQRWDLMMKADQATADKNQAMAA